MWDQYAFSLYFTQQINENTTMQKNNKQDSFCDYFIEISRRQVKKTLSDYQI